jgi:hypothetical protein
MPFTGNHADDIGIETTEGPVCKFDVEGDEVKRPEAIFAGGVEFFAYAATDGDRELAERLTRRNMRMLPYWQSRPFALLERTVATDAEFAEAMARL